MTTDTFTAFYIENVVQCDRNANTGCKILYDTVLRKSVHTIHHSAEHPAELILPVLS